MKQARSTYPATYLWLWAGLLLFNVETQAQEAYKQLGWAERTMTVNVSASELRQGNSLKPPSSAVMLNANLSAKAGVAKFRSAYPGYESVWFTNELLRDFEATEKQTEGFHIFLGKQSNRLITMIVNTDINQENNPGWTTDNRNKGYYRAKFGRVYFWNHRARRWDVKNTNPKLLRSLVKKNTTSFELERKGFFLAKGALLAAWKQSGEQPLKLYFTIQDQELHLFLPYCLTTDLTAAQSASNRHTGQLTLPVHYFYTVAGGQQAVSGAISAGPGQTTVTGSGGSPGTGAVFKTHGSVRCCPSYCGGLDEG